MQPLPDALWPQIGTLVVNEVEAAEYTGLSVADGTGAVAAARALMQRGVRRVVVTDWRVPEASIGALLDVFADAGVELAR